MYMLKCEFELYTMFLFYIYILEVQKFTVHLTPPTHSSTMGTPDDTMWPGVTSLPDYKSTFPKWPSQKLQAVIKSVEPEALELLQVRSDHNILLVTTDA